MKRGVWAAVLGVLALAMVPLGVLALIFAAEGFASLRSHPRNLGLACVSAAFLVVAPVSLVGSGWHWLKRRQALSVRWVVVPFTALFLAWGVSLAIAAG